MVVALGIACVALGAGFLLGKRNPHAEKISPYECGFEPFGEPRVQFDVRYYLLAILFIVFDLEIAFIVPWAVSLDTLDTSAFIIMAIFLLELLVGLVYAWKKGALEWQ